MSHAMCRNTSISKYSHGRMACGPRCGCDITERRGIATAAASIHHYETLQKVYSIIVHYCSNKAYTLFSIEQMCSI